VVLLLLTSSGFAFEAANLSLVMPGQSCHEVKMVPRLTRLLLGVA
jgi:hypothetical protein